MARHLIRIFASVIFTFFIGTIILFLITRLSPIDPLNVIMSKLMAVGVRMSPEEYESMRNTFVKLYGLDKPMLYQYLAFIRGLFSGDLGPSFVHFPTPVTEMISRSLPWTVGLLTVSIVISWAFGILIGAIAGYFDQKNWSKTLEGTSLILSLIPFPVLALLLAMLFIYFIPIFPFYGGAPPGVAAGFSLQYIIGIVRHAFLPALSVILISMGTFVVSARALAITVKTEDFVEYAELRGLARRRVLLGYILRNCLLPQITALALSLGQVFSGALVVEYIFAYPGLGQLLFYAIANGDYNLMMGIVFFSLVGICIAILILEFIYPLIDPRIRVGE